MFRRSYGQVMQEGLDLIQQGRYKEARSRFYEAVLYTSTDYQPQFFIGMTFYQEGNYKEALKPLIKRNKIIAYTPQQLGDILINFYTIKQLIEEIPNVYFELSSTKLLVEKLDLSDYLEFEVKGTPWGWRNNIRKISKITGLENLTHLKKLDLSDVG